MTPKSNRPKKLRILIVDDHAVFRQGLSELINQESDLIVCGEAESAAEALRVIEATHPDVTVVDMSLKHSDGIDLAKDIRLRHPHLPVLILSMHDESLYAERALRAGALGYITKQEAADKVMSAIRCVSGGEVYVSAQFSRRMMRGLVGHGASAAGLLQRRARVLTAHANLPVGRDDEAGPQERARRPDHPLLPRRVSPGRHDQERQSGRHDGYYRAQKNAGRTGT